MEYLVGRFKRQTLDYVIYNHDSRKCKVFNEKSLIKYVLDKHIIENLRVSNNKLVCTQGNLNKYYDVTVKKCMTVIGIEDKKYTVIVNTGKLLRLSEDELIRTSRQIPMTNATVEVLFQNTKNERVLIKPLGKEFKQLKDKAEALGYDLSDFEMWRKRYKRVDYGVYGDSSAHDGGPLTTPFGQEIKMKNSEIYDFINCYKIVRSRIITNREYEYRAIYSRYRVEKGQVKAEGDIVGYHIIWKNGREVFILAEDKKMVSALYKGNERVESLKALEDMLVYSKEEPDADDCITASEQICDRFNKDSYEKLIKDINEGQVDYIFVDKKYNVCWGNNSMKFKYKNKLASREHRKLDV